MPTTTHYNRVYRCFIQLAALEQRRGQESPDRLPSQHDALLRVRVKRRLRRMRAELQAEISALTTRDDWYSGLALPYLRALDAEISRRVDPKPTHKETHHVLRPQTS